MGYMIQLVEYFQKIAANPPSVKKISREEPKIKPTATDIVRKIKIGQTLKGRVKNTQAVLQIDTRLFKFPYTPSRAHLKLIVGEEATIDPLVGKFLNHQCSIRKWTLDIDKYII